MTDIANMTHEEAARVLRILERAGSKKVAEMLALAERAAETSPPEWRHIYDKRVEIYRAGRVVRWKRTSEEDFDPQLVADVESIFAEEFGRTEGD
jgi:hypothetical protein